MACTSGRARLLTLRLGFPFAPVAVELRHLRYFIAVAEASSFTRAAEALGISQPTLSQQIKQLEAEIGVPLFHRLARRAELTTAGEAFRPYCDRVLKELDAGLTAVSEIAGLMRGTLHMALFHSFSSSLLGPVMSQFALRYPGVRVIARLLPRLEMERELRTGALDLAVAYVSEDTEHIIAETLFQEELVLVVGTRHPLARRHHVPMRVLADLDLVLLTQEFGARQTLDRFFTSTRASPHIVLEMNAIEPILSTVRGTSLATVLSAGAIGSTTGLHAVRLTDPAPGRQAAILWRREGHRSPAALRMAEMVRAAYRTPRRIAEARSRVPVARAARSNDG